MVVSTPAKVPRMRQARGANTPRTAIVILGMHRAGTSALTRVLSLLGCDLPKTLMQATPTNEAGHWESDAIYKLNDRILESAGSAWHDWTEFNPGWFASPKAEQFKEEAVEVIEDEFGGSRLFVLKDPRTCRLLPFWRDVLEDCDVRPLGLLPIRNPLEVAASLQKRNGFEPALGQLLWLRHVLDAEAASRQMPRLFSTYDQLMKSWGRLAEKAQDTLDLKWPRLSDRSAAEIDGFLVESLRHHREPVENVVDNPGLAAWIRETYAITQRWATDGESLADRPALDAIRNQFNAAAPAFSRLISAGQTAHQRVAKLKKSLSEETGKLQAAQAAAAEQREKAARLEKSLSEELGKLQVVQTSLASAEKMKTRVTEELEAERSRASGLEEETEGLRVRLAEDAQAIAASRAQLEASAAAAEDSARATADMRARLSVTESTLAQRQLETEQTAAELKAARDEVEQAHHLRAQTEKIVAGLKAHVDLLRADANDRDKLAAELEKLQHESAEARATYQAEAAALRQELVAREQRNLTDIADMEERLAHEMGRTVSALLNGNTWRFMPSRIRLLRKMAILRRSGLFDADWYRSTYKDVAVSGVDPLKHYVAHGADEGRKPNSTLALFKSTAGET